MIAVAVTPTNQRQQDKIVCLFWAACAVTAALAYAALGMPFGWPRF